MKGKEAVLSVFSIFKDGAKSSDARRRIARKQVYAVSTAHFEN